MKSFGAIFTFAVLLGTASGANLLTNGSFETASAGNTPPTANTNGEQLNVGSTALQGWTVNGGDEIAWLPTGNGYGLTPEDGSDFLDLTGYADTKPYGGVSQTVSLAAGNYALSFYIGEDQSNAAFQGPNSISASAGDQSNVVFTNSQTGTGNIWQLQTLNFNVATAGDTTISLIGDTAGGGGAQYIGLDNVSLAPMSNSPVPEPSTAIPMLIAAVGFVAARKASAK